MVQIPDKPQKDRLPFITGSRAYGMPRQDSDLDMVIFVDSKTFTYLIEASDHGSVTGESDARNEMSQANLKFGNLNLIVVLNDKDYNAWKNGTEYLVSRKPVTRHEAITLLERMKNGSSN